MPKLKPRPWQTALAKRDQKRLLKLIRDSDVILRRALLEAAAAVDEIIASLPEKGVGAFARKAMYIQKRDSLLKELDQLWIEDVQRAVRDGIKRASGLSVISSEDILAFLMRAAPADAETLAGSLMASARRTWRDVQSRILNAIDLSPRVYRSSALTAGKIDQLVNEGISLGKSAREIADSVKGFINPRTPGGVRHAAMRLGRTELNNAFHTTSVQSYAAAPWVEGVLWNLSGSHPSPDNCNDFADHEEGLGRGVFPRDAVPFKPHPHCFCYITAITPEPDAFVENLLSGAYGV